MDMSGINGISGKILNPTSSPADTDVARKPESQTANKITLPSPNEQRTENIRAASNQQVPETNASNKNSDPSSSTATAKPTISSNVSQAMVQQAVDDTRGRDGGDKTRVKL